MSFFEFHTVNDLINKVNLIIESEESKAQILEKQNPINANFKVRKFEEAQGCCLWRKETVQV